MMFLSKTLMVCGFLMLAFYLSIGAWVAIIPAWPAWLALAVAASLILWFLRPARHETR
jgi:hypothetical protein